ncbi:hypothetical protein BH18THE2_BH18THE2_00370 [soil metagenome]
MANSHVSSYDRCIIEYKSIQLKGMLDPASGILGVGLYNYYFREMNEDKILTSSKVCSLWGTSIIGLDCIRL